MRPACALFLTAISAGVGLADDRQACLNEAEPIDAIAACTRLIASAAQAPMQAGDAYYNRGLAFMELEEWEHARIDFERSLEFKPDSESAGERLRELEEDGRVTPRNR